MLTSKDQQADSTVENFHKGEVLSEKDGIQVIDCESCGFKHLNPLPSEKELESFYQEAFYEEKSTYLEDHQRDLDWKQVDYAMKYRFFEASLGKTGRLLDIGSGPGFFLKTGEQRGWDVHGIEPGESAQRFSTEELGLDVERAFFCEENYRDFGTYDVVYMNNVLEHMLDPRSTLRWMAEITQPGGLVAISVPNDYNPLQLAAQKTLGLNPWWVAPKMHVNYFDEPSLRALFESIGLEVLKSFTAFPMELFLLMGDDYISQKDLGRAMHEKRKAFEMNLESFDPNLLDQLYEKLAELGFGRLITLVARKA